MAKPPAKMSERERRIRKRLRDDFVHYAQKCLRIRTKEGGVEPFVPNEPQLYLHNRLEAQKREIGKIRTLIVKGRQQGCSTYVEGRYYQHTTHKRGVRAYILTHEDKATSAIFEMVDRFHTHCPSLVKPSTGASNAKELIFDKLDSGYAVGTARVTGTGRGTTIQLFHGSEVAYWNNAATHVAGVLQAIPDLPGTEIILESTSNGPEGVFYQMCMAAQRGESEYQLIFIPWFWSKEYTKAVPDGFELTSEEERYKEDHGLTDGQMYWRRMKVVELGGMHHFRREYPATVDEAFKSAAVGAIWTQEQLESARVPTMPTDSEGEPLEMTKVAVAVDPSGGDGPNNDEVGIMVGGLATDGNVYVWKDSSGKYSPDGWARKAIAEYERNKADCVVAETNFGGAMVESVIRSANRQVAVRQVTASRGKAIRAEPVHALYERGRVKHVGVLAALEDEQVTWVPGESKWSPNRLDALVWLVTHLVLGVSGKIRQQSC